MRESADSGGGRGLQPRARQLTPSASLEYVVLFPAKRDSGASPEVSKVMSIARPGSAARIAAVVVLFVATFIWFTGSSNPFTPAGYVGYLTKGAVMGHSRFYGVQRGP